MKTYKIREPIWSKMAIGIDELRLTDSLLIEITYTNKTGIRPYPHIYKVKLPVSGCYETQVVKGHLLILIPIRDLIIYERRDPKVAKKTNLRKVNNYLKAIEPKGQEDLWR